MGLEACKHPSYSILGVAIAEEGLLESAEASRDSCCETALHVGGLGLYSVAFSCEATLTSFILGAKYEVLRFGGGIRHSSAILIKGLERRRKIRACAIMSFVAYPGAC